MIRLCFLKSLTTRAVNYSFNTLSGARRRAQKLVGTHPKADPDGYVVDRDGNCLFFSGCKLEDLFPSYAESSVPTGKAIELSDAQIPVLELLANKIAMAHGEARSFKHKELAAYMALSIGLGTMARDMGGGPDLISVVADLDIEVCRRKMKR